MKDGSKLDSESDAWRVGHKIQVGMITLAVCEERVRLGRFREGCPSLMTQHPLITSTVRKAGSYRVIVYQYGVRKTTSMMNSTKSWRMYSGLDYSGV